MPLVQTRGAASAQGFGEFAQVTAVNYIEDVFSTYLYTGTGALQTITNNIDLSTKGGLVWLKSRSATYNHYLQDTTRGIQNTLTSNDTSAQSVANDIVNSTSTSGFVVQSYSGGNNSGSTYASWTFRKQPKFFDVVTWTSTNNANARISHNLGSVPGCYIIKRTDGAGNWFTYHTSLGRSAYVSLNATNASASATNCWGTTDPTSTDFGVNETFFTPGSGNYVAYVFASNAGGFGLTGTDNVISCGSFTTDGTGAAGNITLGYESQWILLKRTDGVGSWNIIDTMRGSSLTSYNYLQPNASTQESSSTSAGQGIFPTSTGFFVGTNFPAASATYIYIAIRRGPMKVPTSGTSVFSPTTYAGNGSTQTITTGVTPDLELIKSRTLNSGLPYAAPTWYDRLRGAPGIWLRSDSTAAEVASGSPYYSIYMDEMNGFRTTSDSYEANYSGNNYISYSFKRAPSFFDEVCATGTSTSNQRISHNLTVVPELIISKGRDRANAWPVYSGSINSIIYLNSTSAIYTNGSYFPWGTSAPTTTDFGINSGTLDLDNFNGVFYLFATCAGVSKVGSYTGTGTTLQINCGFTAGARFVLIKRTDSTGDWYVWDSARGIVSGNDSYLLLNSTAAEVTNTDYIDTYSAGFEISSTAPAAINANGGTFIFLAIA